MGVSDTGEREFRDGFTPSPLTPPTLTAHNSLDNDAGLQTPRAADRGLRHVRP
jgi:hypothetical protein